MKHANCGGDLKPSKRTDRDCFWYRCEKCKKFVNMGTRRFKYRVHGIGERYRT